LYYLLYKDLRRRANRGQLKLLLRTEMSKYAGFAHVQFGGEATDRKAFQTFRRRKINCELQDLATCLGGLICVIQNPRFHRTIVLFV